MKKVLILEDNMDLAETYKKRFFGVAEVVAVDNLIAFDEQLFDLHGIERYDRVIIDLAIPLVDLNLEDLLEMIPEMHEDVTRLKGTIPLFGWDYFRYKILENPENSKYVSKFVIISGHGDMFREYLECNKIQLNIEIIDKTDSDLSEKLLELLR